ncbi:MAG: restriction endonuclease subunit S [Mesorhizobium sp.]|nr:MAG: restriction endonuclease subunit S [Mesorhizobium sp.]
MSFQRYQNYRNSGIDWLQEIPEHWNVRRLGYYFAERREKVSDKDFSPLSVTKNGIVPQLETAAKTDDGDNRKRVAAGDFVINSRSDRKGSAGIAAQDGSVSLINTVLTPLDGVDRRFVHHLLRSTAFQEEFYRYGKGIVADLWSTNYSEMRAISLAMPPLPEQTAIAAFLDRETGKIDALVEEQRRLIELLKEKRQAVISHAVTKGLNPDVQMKDSGVEWLGEVPKHWVVKQLRHFAEVLRGKFTHRPRNDPAFYDGDYPFVQTGDITGASKFITSFKQTLNERGAAVSKEFPRGTLVMAIAANIGDVAILDFPAYFPDSIVGLVPNQDTRLPFLYFLMRAMKQPMLRTATISTQMNLNVDQIVSLVAACPPTEEQERIAPFLETQTAKFDGLITQAETAVSLLQERRAALISAVVTGKIDVRTAAIRIERNAIAETRRVFA